MTRVMPKTVSYTCRIDQEAYDAMVEEARNSNLSVSSLLNQILKRYARFDRVAVRLRLMKFSSRPALAALLEHMSEDHLEGVGRRLGESHPTDVLRSLGMPIDSSSFVTLLEVLSTDICWFTLERSRGPEGLIFHLRNDIGWKWTKYLMGYFESAAKKIFALSVTREVTEFTLTIRLRTSPKMDL